MTTATLKARCNPILYANPAVDIFLLDIPTSIAAAQQRLPSQQQLRLLSTAPPTAPYPSNAPKTAKAREALRARTQAGDEERDALYTTLIRGALEELKQAMGEREWCLPRAVMNEITEDSSEATTTRKRKRDIDAQPHEPPNVAASALATARPLRPLPQPTSHHINPTAHPLCLPAAPHTLPLPPFSAYLQGPLPDSTSTLAALLTQPLDLLLLDPPYPNRSARRSRSYATRAPRTLAALHDLLAAIPVAEMLAPGAWVAVWVTHRAEVRALVLRLFERWGVRLVEEWVWAKVTVEGEAVVGLDGGWRRGWEVCFVGRAGAKALVSEEVKRRVLVAVPDVHSRKPCLKGLFERLLLEGKKEGEYVGLEVFARHLVAGWWSWGDEVLKFMGREWWSAVEERSKWGEEQQDEKEVTG